MTSVALEDRIGVPHDPAGVAEARSLARERLQRWGVPVDHDRAVLLLSEVVTNAVVHGTPPATVHLVWDGEALRVGVADAEVLALPCAQEPDFEAQRGRGLFLVDTLADRWGIEIGEEAKTVWFELRAGSEHREPAL